MKKKLIIWTIVSVFFTQYSLARFNTSAQSFAFLLNNRVNIQRYGIFTPPSPVYILDKPVPAGTDLIEIFRKNNDKHEVFSIPADKRKEMSLTFALNYNNLGNGVNQYTVSFRKSKTLLELAKFQVNVSYEEEKFGNISLYLHGPFFSDSELLLAKYGETFNIIKSPFIYDESQQLLIEPRNIISGDNFTTAQLYVNGIDIGRFPYSYLDSGGNELMKFIYDKDKNTFIASRGIGSGGCFSFYKARGVSLDTGEEFLDLTIGNKRPSVPEGITVIYNQKRRELTPALNTINGVLNFGLKHKYMKYVNNTRQVSLEEYAVKNQVVLDTGELCESLNYTFNSDNMSVIVTKGENLGGKNEQFRRQFSRLPSFYKKRI